jgi:hypothetical protein
MEVWNGQTYESIMSIPVTRRHRLALEKTNLEKKRTNDHNAAMSRARSRR